MFRNYLILFVFVSTFLILRTSFADFITNVVQEDEFPLALSSQERAYTQRSDDDLIRSIPSRAQKECERKGFDGLVDFEMDEYSGKIDNLELYPQWHYQTIPNYSNAIQCGAISALFGLGSLLYSGFLDECQQKLSGLGNASIMGGFMATGMYAGRSVSSLMSKDLTGDEAKAYFEEGREDQLQIKYLGVQPIPHLVFSEIQCRIFPASVIRILSQNQIIPENYREFLVRATVKSSARSLSRIAVDEIARQIYESGGFAQFRQASSN